MQTFEELVLNVYLPAYKRLYVLNSSLSTKELFNNVLVVATDLKEKDNNSPVGVEIVENCNNILNRSTIALSKISKADVANMLLKLLYALRVQLIHFCRDHEYGVLEESTYMKLKDHWTWKRTLQNYTDQSYRLK